MNARTQTLKAQRHILCGSEHGNDHAATARVFGRKGMNEDDRGRSIYTECPRRPLRTMQLAIRRASVGAFLTLMMDREGQLIQQQWHKHGKARDEKTMLWTLRMACDMLMHLLLGTRSLEIYEEATASLGGPEMVLVLALPGRACQ